MAVIRPPSNTIGRQDLQGTFNQGLMGFVPAVDKVLTPIGVEKRRGLFDTETLASLAAAPTGLERERKSGFKIGTAYFDELSWRLQPYGFGFDLDTIDEDDATDQATKERRLSQKAMDIVYRDQERRFAALITTGNFPNGTYGTAVSNAWSSSSGTPRADIAAGFKAMKVYSGGLEPNKLVIGWQKAWDLWNSEDFRKEVRYVQGISGAPQASILAGAFGLKEVVIAGGMINSAGEGLSPTMADLWTNTQAFLCRCAETEDIEEPCVGRLFYHTQKGGRMSVVQYSSDDGLTENLLAWQYVQEKLLFVRAGYLMTSV